MIRRKCSLSRRGIAFTLIELLVVIAITRYCINGAIIAYNSQQPASPKSLHFRLGSLSTTGILISKANDDMTAFNFNDGSNQPSESIIQRHATSRYAKAHPDLIGG